LPLFRSLADLLFRKSRIIAGIEVRGRSAFMRRSEEALALLRNLPLFADIQRHIAVIKQGRRSGMWAQKKRPTFVVGRRTWSHSALWYAGAIAHDAYHSKLYHDARSETARPPADCWTGPDAERRCLGYQIEALKALGADDATVAYLEKLRKNPTYQGHHKGWRSWRDYLRRSW
jgi:hypothetical protein